MPISNQKEEIDSRILRLIGLEDVFDLDYDTYLSLLKEAMVKGRMAKTTIPTEEVELLTNEYKRVKGKKDSGRFEVKKKKITSSSFSVGSIKAQIAGTATKALPGTAIGTSPLSKGLGDNISAIASSLVSIAETLRQQKKVSDDASAYDKRKTEQEKRGLAESKLEKRFEGLKKAAEKIIAPVKSLLDRIIQFFTTVILGRIVYKLVEWLGDPNNASKVKSVIRFVKDWWPALLGSYILFGSSFGKLIRGTLGLVGRFIFQIGRVSIPQLLRFIKSPVGIGVGLFTAGATIPAMFPGTVNKQESQTSKAPGSKEDKIRSLQQQKATLNFFEKLQGKGSEIDEQISYLQTGKTKSYGFNGGGLASGFVSGEKGVDKVPAMLSDGEFVMSRGAVEKYGVDTLEAMNAAGGGTNKPKVVGGKTYAAGGGMVGKSNTPIYKDPIDAVRRFIKFKFGADLSKQSTWGTPKIPSSANSNISRYSSGSLITDPVGAVARIANNMGIRTPNVPSSGFKMPSLSGSGGKNFFQEVAEKLQGPGAATYRNAGNLYAKQMLGGFGGPISERDLAPESQKELLKAIERAKKRTGSQIRITENKIKKLEADGAKNTPKGREALANERSFLRKLKAGGIRVQYADYADERGNMSASAENAKNILGQFWAYGRDKKQGSGYRIEDRYDFDMFKKKDEKTGKMRDMNIGELIMEGVLGKGKTTQQRLQAAYLLNSLRGKGDVDMVLGGNRTAAENAGLAWSKTLLGGMLGVSGSPKDKNTQALEAKRPWWDKAGWFGGGSRVVKDQVKQTQIARKKPTTKVIKPPSKPSVIYTYPKSSNKTKPSSIYNRPSASKPPSFSASTKGSRSKINIFGIHI